MTLVNSETGEVIVPLSEDEARALTEQIRTTAEALWSLFVESYERQAWRALGYSSWRDYATTEFGMSQSRAYQLLDQGRVIRAIEEVSGSTDVEITEAEARDIKPRITEVTETVRRKVSSGVTPRQAVEETVEEVRSTLRSVEVEPDPEPTVAEVVTTIPWSFKKEVTQYEPRTASEAASFFDDKRIRSDEVWSKHLANFPARLRPAAMTVAQQQVQFWQQAVESLSQTTRPRSA